MKNVQYSLAIFLCVFALPFLSTAQDRLIDDLSCEVNRILPYISITETQISEAQTLSDLDRNFKPSWVKEYVSVELSTSQQGKIQKALSRSNKLTSAQKNNLKTADINTDISVIVRYIPDNTLSHNDVKEYSFTFTAAPDKEASYTGGVSLLNQYLQENVLNKIPANSLKGFDLVAVNFTVSAAGEIIDTHVFNSAYQTYQNESVEKLLLNSIRKMPCWIPAEYSDGTKVSQQFALTVGNHKSCVVNLLNIRKLPVE